MDATETVKNIVEAIAQARNDIQRLAEGTARKMENIRVSTRNKDTIREINEYILDHYSILVCDGNSYVSATPEIQENGSVCLVDDYGNKYGYDRLIPNEKYHIFASVGDVWAFYEAIEDVEKIAKEKGLLEGVGNDD